MSIGKKLFSISAVPFSLPVFAFGKRDKNWPKFSGKMLSNDDRQCYYKSEGNVRENNLKKWMNQNVRTLSTIFVVIATYQINARQNVLVETAWKKKYQHITDFVATAPNLPALSTNFPAIDVKTPVQQKFFSTRTDNIRKEHDRGKKRPFKQLTLDKLYIAKKKK